MAFYDSINDINNLGTFLRENPEQDFSIFAKGYAYAASALAEFLLEKPNFSPYEAYPVLFLYRHAFELYLKGFYYKAGLLSYFKNVEDVEVDNSQKYKHALVPFAIVFKKLCAVLFPSDNTLSSLAIKVNQIAVEFEQIDKDSFSYRYPINTKGNASIIFRKSVNLLAVYQTMRTLLNDLEVVDFGFDVETGMAQEVFEIIQEAQSAFRLENGETG